MRAITGRYHRDWMYGQAKSGMWRPNHSGYVKTENGFNELSAWRR